MDLIAHSDVGAIILCGGHGRRMGRPKTWLPFGPQEVLLQRVARQVQALAAPVVVVAAPGQDLPPLPASLRIARDAVADRGPLQGLASGLRAINDDVEFVYATATDAPFLAPRWIGHLRERIGDCDLAIPRISGRFHPLAALYRRSTALAAIEVLLNADRRRMMDLIECVRGREIEEHELRGIDPGLQTLENLNHPEEYRRAIEREFR